MSMLSYGSSLRQIAALIVVSATMAGGCSSVPTATPTPYQSAKLANGYGYSSVQLSDNEFRVMFKATEATPADKVQEYTLVRAAEIAQAHGFQWIAIVKTDVQKQASVGKTVVREKTENQPKVLKEHQCTMSGCSEVANPFIDDGIEMKVETQPMDDVFYSILVRMGDSDINTDPKAMRVSEVLQNQLSTK